MSMTCVYQTHVPNMGRVPMSPCVFPGPAVRRQPPEDLCLCTLLASILIATPATPSPYAPWVWGSAVLVGVIVLVVRYAISTRAA